MRTTPRPPPGSWRRTSTTWIRGCGRACSTSCSSTALDAWLTPIIMKRGRPATTVHALVRQGAEVEMSTLLMDRTGSLGVRRHRVEREIRTRDFTEVTVRGQRVAVKIARDGEGRVQ